MTTAAHTPGPLYPRQNSAGMWELHVEDKPYSFSTAFVCSPVEHAEADARLYGAAPELLAACRHAIVYDDAIKGCANDPAAMSSYCTAQGDTLDTLYEAWIDSARAASAKATGSAK